LSESNQEIITQDNLMKAIGKSEVLTEEHEDALEEVNEATEEIEGWLTVILKLIKNSFI
jgi:hypothetical protein